MCIESSYGGEHVPVQQRESGLPSGVTQTLYVYMCVLDAGNRYCEIVDSRPPRLFKLAKSLPGGG